MHEAELMEASEAISSESYERALALLRPLAEQAVPGALGLLGVMYQLGSGVEREGPKAVALLGKAAELGDGTSAHNLGTIYAMGLPGVPQDFQLSRQFFRAARAIGAQCAPDEFYE